MAFLKKSPWIIHYDGSSCNGCDIETLACLTPVYDVERFGIINTGNPKHADVLLITGAINEQNKSVVRNIYNQMPDPKVVVAVGTCALTGGIFCDCYNIIGGVDKILPVDVYVPGCAARPEAIIDGVIKGVTVLEEKAALRKDAAKKAKRIAIEEAIPDNAEEILALQKVCYQIQEAAVNAEAGPCACAQTMEDMKKDFGPQTILKAVFEGKIFGSVRGIKQNGTCQISHLLVHPVFEHHGVADRLMDAIEKHFPASPLWRMELPRAAVGHLDVLHGRGYRTVTGSTPAEETENITVEKINPKASSRDAGQTH